MSAPQLTGRGQGFLAVGVTTAVVAMLLGFPDITRIGVLLTVLPLLSLLSTWSRQPRLTVHRTVAPAAVRPGEQLRVRLEVRNDARGRTPVHLGTEHVAPGLGGPVRLLVPRLEPGEGHVLRYEVTAARRGRYRLGPLTVRQHDPFGLTHLTVGLPGHREVVVLPRVEDLGTHAPTAHGQGRAGHVPRMVAAHGEDDASIRAFREGDDLRRVHWPTTAHRGELMVRQEDRPARRRAVLLLDSRRRAHRGRGEDSSLEWAVSALASVALHLAGRGYALHLVTSEGAATIPDRPEPVEEVLARLAEARPAETDDHGQMQRAAQPLTTGGGLVVAVTTDRDQGDVDRLATVRPPGAAGVLLVLRTASFADVATSPSAAPSPPGWQSAVVHAGDSVRLAWDRATEGTVAGVPS